MDKGIIICDIDGTLAKVGQRQLILEHEPVDWEAFYADDFNDEPISEMCWLVGRLMESGYNVVFCTSRRECVREKTEHAQQAGHGGTESVEGVGTDGRQEPHPIRRFLLSTLDIQHGQHLYLRFGLPSPARHERAQINPRPYV